MNRDVVTIFTAAYPSGMDLKVWVKAERDRRGWTQDQLAELAGLRRVEVNAVERGRNKGTSARVREGLAKAFGVPAKNLAAEPGDASTAEPTESAPVYGSHPQWLSIEK